jgi:uncharacterized protein YjbJ (UPF0337 family)
MTALTVKANWNITKGKLKQQFARLRHDDQQFIEGKENELTGRIQKRSELKELQPNTQPTQCCSGSACRH